MNWEEYLAIEKNLVKAPDKRGYYSILGNVPILLTASHSCDHTRHGRVLIGERRTASIITDIANRLNCYALYKTLNLNDDANDETSNYFKDVAMDLINDNKIQLLIDLHISSPLREHSVEFGTNSLSSLHGRTDLLDVLVRGFENSLCKPVYVDKFFKASKVGNFSRYLHGMTNIPCMQLEINWNTISTEINCKYFVEILYDSLSEIIQKGLIL